MSNPRSAARKLADNATKISAFSKDIQFKEVPTLPASDDFVSRFSENTAARKDFSNEFIVNVLPNFVPILCYILFYVNKLTPLLEISKHAKLSAGTFTAYCLIIVYGYILCSDAYVRPTPSQHAYEWLNDHARHEFMHFIMSLPVPTFLVPILKKLTPTTTEYRGNISFVPSAAGFFYSMHFGRFFPVNMFTNIHDCAAENASNQSPAAVMSDYFARSLYTITRHRDGAAAFNASPAHFLGTWFLSGGNAAANQSSYGSRLEQLFQSVFNPVLFRDYQRRQTLASISLATPTFATRFMNFYDIVFCCSARSATMNLSELKIMCQSISSALNGNIPCTGDLASHFKDFSGLSILQHGYSLFRLPTFHHSTTAPQAMTTRPARVTPSDFATAIRFLQTPTATTTGTTTTDPTQPTGRCTTDRTHPVTVTTNATTNRLLTTNAAPFVPSFTQDFLVFSEDIHVYPKVYVMSLDASTVDAWQATAFGFVIESNEIDGTVIPVPNTRLSLGIENTWFADSAIPVRYCYWSTMFDVQATTSRTFSRNRELAPRQTRFPAASLLVNRILVNIPRLTSTVFRPIPDALVPGLTSLDNVNWPSMIQSFFGFRTADRRSNNDDIPGIETRRFLVWSPYTYVGVEGENGYTPAFNDTRTYFLTNLRTIFGTDVPLIECNDGLESMPVF